MNITSLDLSVFAGRPWLISLFRYSISPAMQRKAWREHVCGKGRDDEGSVREVQGGIWWNLEERYREMRRGKGCKSEIEEKTWGKWAVYWDLFQTANEDISVDTEANNAFRLGRSWWTNFKHNHHLFTAAIFFSLLPRINGNFVIKTMYWNWNHGLVNLQPEWLYMPSGLFIMDNINIHILCLCNVRSCPDFHCKLLIQTIWLLYQESRKLQCFHRLAKT